MSGTGAPFSTESSLTPLWVRNQPHAIIVDHLCDCNSNWCVCLHITKWLVDPVVRIFVNIVLYFYFCWPDQDSTNLGLVYLIAESKFAVRYVNRNYKCVLIACLLGTLLGLSFNTLSSFHCNLLWPITDVAWLSQVDVLFSSLAIIISQWQFCEAVCADVHTAPHNSLAPIAMFICN